jgi:uncharacterized damage-inducible protein DinB
MDLRYPIRKFEWEGELTEEKRRQYIEDIAETPGKLRAAVAGLSETQLDAPYRDGGWTVRQVVHHLADSHMQAYARFKLALTEDEPTVKPYDEKRWAELVDAKTAPVETSLTLLESLHGRRVMLLRSMRSEHFKRKLQHPELGELTLEKYLAMYAWHGPHHVAHITGLQEQVGWR